VLAESERQSARRLADENKKLREDFSARQIEFDGKKRGHDSGSGSGGGSGSGSGSGSGGQGHGQWVRQRHVPDEHLCPITKEVMVSPVLARDGHTYEKDAISNWFQRHRNNPPSAGGRTQARAQGPRSPMTNEPMDSEVLVPNLALKKLIADFQQQSNGESR
jgi:hypothetical protein